MTTDHDLAWLAFCYTAGELPVADAEVFEQRLAADQPAREALARAVELTQVVAAAESHASVVLPAARSQTGWRIRAAWMAIGGIASLLAALLVTGNLKIPRSSLTARQSRLAAAWSETRTQIRSDAELGLWSSEQSRTEPDDDLLATVASPTGEAIEETPSWLNAALGITTDAEADSSSSDTSSGD